MDLQQIQARLHQQLEQLQDRLSKVMADLSQPHSADSEEQAQERENDEVLENIALETKESIEHIKAALSRISNGNYGICESCGGKIAEARLEALPEATLCVKCADLIH